MGEEKPPHERQLHPRGGLTGADFEEGLKASATHQKLIERVNEDAELVERHERRLKLLEQNWVVQFGRWVIAWRRVLLWVVSLIVGLWALIFAVDRLHEVFHWVPDLIVTTGTPPSPSP